MHVHETNAIAHEKAHARIALAALIFSVAAAILAVTFALALIWSVMATPRATAFDADGVRCYRAANQMSCIKTANP